MQPGEPLSDVWAGRKAGGTKEGSGRKVGGKRGRSVLKIRFRYTGKHGEIYGEKDGIYGGITVR